jgi:hypothetical protein
MFSGGGAGAGAVSARLARFSSFTIWKIIKAKIRKLISTARKLPYAKTAPAFFASIPCHAHNRTGASGKVRRRNYLLPLLKLCFAISICFKTGLGSAIIQGCQKFRKDFAF